ncbi:tetratricopeptide repeat protein [Chitinimonas naiadis]
MQDLRYITATLLAIGLVAACAREPVQPPTKAEIESTGLLATNGRQAKAQAQLLAWAEQGYAVAQRELALGYARDPKGYAMALVWFEKAGHAGDAEAAFQLGEAYRLPALGASQSLKTAWDWYRLAAEHKHPLAALSLARMARNGDGVPKDVQLGARWLNTASELGNPQAMFLLSNAYLEGEGVPRNPLMARRLLELSAERHYPAALHALAMAVEGGDMLMLKDQERAGWLRKEAAEEARNRWNTY